MTTRRRVSSYEFRKGMEYEARALRKGGQRFDYFARVEFTSGRAASSRRVRRMHAHVLCKGLTGDVRLLERVVRKAWPHGWRVEVAELRTVGGAIHYLGLHEPKASQLPPESWRGMAERASRRYWHRPVTELRKEAQEQLRAAARHLENVRQREGLAISEALASAAWSGEPLPNGLLALGPWQRRSLP